MIYWCRSRKSQRLPARVRHCLWHNLAGGRIVHYFIKHVTVPVNLAPEIRARNNDVVPPPTNVLCSIFRTVASPQSQANELLPLAVEVKQRARPGNLHVFLILHKRT